MRLGGPALNLLLVMSVSLPSTSIFILVALLRFLLFLPSLYSPCFLFLTGSTQADTHTHTHTRTLTQIRVDVRSLFIIVRICLNTRGSKSRQQPFSLCECGGTFGAVMTAYICGSVPSINRSRGVCGFNRIHQAETLTVGQAFMFRHTGSV